jgi:Mce-associated membrane protein
MTGAPRLALRRSLFGMELVPAVLVLLVVVCCGLAGSLYFNQYRPTQQTDPGVAATVVRSASEGTVALLSYAPESLDKDFAAARSHLSGDFLTYYNDLSQRIIAPAAKQKSLKTSARVVAAALSELRPNSGVVLLYVDQTTTSSDNPDPTISTKSAMVRMVRVNDKWLIAKFDPY